MEKTINRIIKDDYQDVKGTDLKIRLPIIEEVIQKIFLDSIKGAPINWATIQVGPDNLLLIKVNLSVKVIFSTTFTLSIYIKLASRFEVKEAYTSVAEIIGVSNGLGIGKRKIMNNLREAISQNLPPYLKFKDDRFYLRLKTYLELYEVPLLESFFSEIRIKTEFAEHTPEAEKANAHKLWLETELQVK